MSKVVWPADLDRFLATVKVTDKRLDEKWAEFVASLPDVEIPPVTVKTPSLSKPELIAFIGEEDYALLVTKAGSETELLKVAGGGEIKAVKSG